MNIRPTRILAVAAVTVLGTALFTGCASSGYKQADKTGQGIAEFRAEIVNGKQAIDATMKALDQVAASANTNPRKAYEQFNKSLSNLESVAAKARKRAEDMKARGQAYFAQWEKELAEVQNPDIRKVAAEQKTKLQATFDSIRKYSEPLKAQFDPWMSDLKDLNNYLRNDLSVSGVDAAKSLFTKTQTEGLDVQKSMDALVAELNTVAATLTPANVKPQK